MPQTSTAKVVSMATHTVTRAHNSAADTIWSDIATHLVSIDRIAEGLRQNWAVSETTAEALDVLRGMVKNCRTLQELQRNGRYSLQADDGIATIASEYIPAVLKRVDWPRNSALWLESITLSAATIAQLARQRQAAHKAS